MAQYYSKTCKKRAKTAPLHELYTDKIAEKICKMLSEDFTYQEIEKATGVPMYAFTRAWRFEVPGYHSMYEKARLSRIEAKIRKIENEAEAIYDKIESSEQDQKKAAAYVRASEVKINTLFRSLGLRHPDYHDRLTKTFYLLPQFGEGTAKEKLDIVSMKVAHGEMSAEDAIKLLPIIETQIKIVDIQVLKDELYKELDNLKAIVFEKNKKK